jgi:phospholipid/cholesterol/gamma-HCH transport system ATP-binding protein
MNSIQTDGQIASSSKTKSVEPVIEIHDLKKSFGDQDVLKNVTLRLFSGENLAVLGKSGSGKSVLIQCIVRLLNSDSGTITVLGEDVNALNTEQLGTLRKKIGFPLRRMKKGLSQKELADKVNDALEHVGLPDTLDKMPSQLSGGMRKRISLARTIVVDPMIMLYDEPTTGLDPVTSDEISSLINEVRKKYKTSSIIITHDIRCARAVANRVIMLADGEVHLEGTLETFEKSNDPLIVSFFK